MSHNLRISMFRLMAGLGMMATALAVTLFVLPDASQKRIQQEKALREARTQLMTQEGELSKLKARAENLRLGRERMPHNARAAIEQFLAMPATSGNTAALAAT